MFILSRFFAIFSEIADISETIHHVSIWPPVTEIYTLQKFWRYNKVYLGELVPLEILGDH